MIRTLLLLLLLAAGVLWFRHAFARKIAPKPVDRGKLTPCQGCRVMVPEEQLTLVAGKRLCPNCHQQGEEPQ